VGKLFFLLLAIFHSGFCWEQVHLLPTRKDRDLHRREVAYGNDLDIF